MNSDSLLQLLLKEKEDNQRLQQELSHIRNALHDQQVREYETIIRDLKASLLTKEAEIRGLRGNQPPPQQQHQQKLQAVKPPANKIPQGPASSTNPATQVANPKPVVQSSQNKDQNGNTKAQDANGQAATQRPPQAPSANPRPPGQGRKRDRKRQDKQKDTAQKEKQDQPNAQQASGEQAKQTGAQLVNDKKNDSTGGQAKPSDPKSTRHYKQRQPSNQSKQIPKPNGGTSQRRDRQRKKEGTPNPNSSSNGRNRGKNSANASKSDNQRSQKGQNNERKRTGQSNTGASSNRRKRPNQVKSNDDSLNRRRSQRNPKGQFIQIDGEFIQLPKDVDVPPSTKQEKNSNEEKTYTHLMESPDHELDEELSIHRNEDELDEERKLSNEFRAQSGTGGRLRCPAPSCGATRGLIQSMKQHVRETKGSNGHERVYCLKCDSVFFKSKDREEHDTLSNCIAALMSKPRAFLSTKQKDLVVIFEKDSSDHHKGDSTNLKVEEQADEKQQSENQQKAVVETSASGIDQQENGTVLNQTNQQVSV